MGFVAGSEILGSDPALLSIFSDGGCLISRFAFGKDCVIEKEDSLGVMNTNIVPVYGTNVDGNVFSFETFMEEQILLVSLFFASVRRYFGHPFLYIKM